MTENLKLVFWTEDMSVQRINLWKEISVSFFTIQSGTILFADCSDLFRKINMRICQFWNERRRRRTDVKCCLFT